MLSSKDELNQSSRKLNMGLIGGGQGSFIGPVHRIAAAMDDKISLVCGALSSRSEIALASGRELLLPDDRIYYSYGEMIHRERELPEGVHMDFVAIVTPNHLHFDAAMQALEQGFHVVIDKPITLSSDEARKLKAKVEETGLLLCVTHTYAGYPMVKQAKDMIRRGLLGAIRKIYVEYPQGWLSNAIELSGSAQADWRTDPDRNGQAGSMGDIGTHAAHLAEYITGLRITELCANLNTVVPSRKLYDDGDVLLKFDNGASGTLSASQIAAGEENALKIRIYGDRGGMEWSQQDPNNLTLRWLDEPIQVYRAGANQTKQLCGHALAHLRTPYGHPEGYLEAFANIYRSFATTLSSKLNGVPCDTDTWDFPDVNDGLRGMLFIDSVVASAQSDAKWTKFKM